MDRWLIVRHVPPALLWAYWGTDTSGPREMSESREIVTRHTPLPLAVLSLWQCVGCHEMGAGSSSEENNDNGVGIRHWLKHALVS